MGGHQVVQRRRSAACSRPSGSQPASRYSRGSRAARAAPGRAQPRRRVCAASRGETAQTGSPERCRRAVCQARGRALCARSPGTRALHSRRPQGDRWQAQPSSRRRGSWVSAANPSSARSASSVTGQCPGLPATRRRRSPRPARTYAARAELGPPASAPDPQLGARRSRASQAG